MLIHHLQGIVELDVIGTENFGNYSADAVAVLGTKSLQVIDLTLGLQPVLRKDEQRVL